MTLVKLLTRSSIPTFICISHFTLSVFVETRSTFYLEMGLVYLCLGIKISFRFVLFYRFLFHQSCYRASHPYSSSD